MRRSTQFRSISKLLQLGGWNVWDARIEARKILDIKGPYDKSIRFPSRLDYPNVSGGLGPDMIPTHYERLEVDFWAMVSDCRAILSGTLKPRPWNELSSTWTDGIINPILGRKINGVPVEARRVRVEKYATMRVMVSPEERRVRKILRYTKKYSEAEIILRAHSLCSNE